MDAQKMWIHNACGKGTTAPNKKTKTALCNECGKTVPLSEMTEVDSPSDIRKFASTTHKD